MANLEFHRADGGAVGVFGSNPELFDGKSSSRHLSHGFSWDAGTILAS